MLSLALNALSLPHNFKDRSTVLTSPQATCPDGCAAQATVHGDPMFKVNGTGTHFWLSEGIMTPLLTSGDIMLSGKTFSRPDTGHQWFDELTVSNKGKVVLDVTTANGRTRVKLDGKVVTARQGRAAGKVSANGVEISFDGTKGVIAKAGGFAVNIFPEEAKKFSSRANKAKYQHLNADFLRGIPNDSKGIFAELAGVQQMSKATNALLKEPNHNDLALYQKQNVQCGGVPGCVPMVAADWLGDKMVSSIAGSIDDFNEDGYKNGLAGELGVAASAITLLVQGGSIQVTTTIECPDQATACAIGIKLQALAGDLDRLSTVVGATVEGSEAPVLPSFCATATPTAAPTAAPVPCGWQGAGVTPAWTFSNTGGGQWSNSDGAIRFDFDTDVACGGTNPNTQSGTATWTMNLAQASVITLSMHGSGEAGYEYMDLNSDGAQVAHVVAGGPGCYSDGCDMCPVEMAPISLSLAAGEHTLEAHVTTQDGLYQKSAFFEIAFGVEGTPDCPALPVPPPPCGWQGVGVTPSWTFVNDGGGQWSNSAGAIRFDFDTDVACGGTNPNTQSGTATWTMNLAQAAVVTLSMHGSGEAGYEYMDLNSDGAQVAHVVAGGPGCYSDGCDMCPVAMAPISLSLAAGEHTLEAHVTTQDGLYQKSAFFEIAFSVEGVPDCPVLPTPPAMAHQLALVQDITTHPSPGAIRRRHATAAAKLS